MKYTFVCLSASATLALAGCATLGRHQGDSNSVVSPPPAVQNGSIADEENLARPDVVIATVAFQGSENGHAVSDDEPSSFSNRREMNAGEETGSLKARLIAESPNEFTPAPEIGVNLDRKFQPSGERSYTLADVEQLALGNNPTIAAANAASSKAAGLRQQVGTRPNPTVGYFGYQIADQGTDQHGAFVQQKFVRGNKLALNRAVLQQTTNAQQGEYETQRYRVLTDVRLRFYEALIAQKQLDAIHNFTEVARRGVEVATQRQDAQEGTAIDVLQSQTLLSEVTLAAERTEAAYRGSWQDLAAVAGLSATTPARLVAEFHYLDDAPDWDTQYHEIVAISPEMAVARALVCEKQAMLKRQKVQMIPNLTGQLGVGYDDAVNSSFLNVTVGAPIPVWNKNSGNVSAAYADYVQAIKNQNRIEQAIKARLARAAQEYNASLASVTKYREQIIPQTKKSLELSDQAYRLGQMSFLQALVVRRSYYDSTIQQIAAEGKLAQASAKINGLLLTGGLDASSDYTNGDGVRGQTFSGL